MSKTKKKIQKGDYGYIKSQQKKRTLYTLSLIHIFGARLKGTGFLLANDISNSRAKALLKNLELAGLSNIYVTSEDPKRLTGKFPSFFDKILIDAPCSGEGMFHKEPKMAEYWEEKPPAYYAGIQKELICQGAQMLRPGGMLLYSTCTFSKKENEEVIAYLLESCPDMEVMQPKWLSLIHI